MNGQIRSKKDDTCWSLENRFTHGEKIQLVPCDGNGMVTDSR